MKPSNVSLVIGALLGFVLAVIVLGFSRSTPLDRCEAVARAFEQTNREIRRAGIRGSVDEPLSVSESAAISVAGAVSNALGVSCYVAPGISA
jgi:hypothetical protein